MVQDPEARDHNPVRGVAPVELEKAAGVAARAEVKVPARVEARAPAKAWARVKDKVKEEGSR